MDFEAHRQAMVAHFVWLYHHLYAGPGHSREAVAAYLKRSGCPFPKIGHDVKVALDAASKEEK